MKNKSKEWRKQVKIVKELTDKSILKGIKESVIICNNYNWNNEIFLDDVKNYGKEEWEL